MIDQPGVQREFSDDFSGASALHSLPQRLAQYQRATYGLNEGSSASAELLRTHVLLFQRSDAAVPELPEVQGRVEDRRRFDRERLVGNPAEECQVIRAASVRSWQLEQATSIVTGQSAVVEELPPESNAVLVETTRRLAAGLP